MDLRLVNLQLAQIGPNFANNVFMGSHRNKFSKIILSCAASMKQLLTKGHRRARRSSASSTDSKHLCPFVKYADTEALCLSVDNTSTTFDESTKLEEQKPCSFGASLNDRNLNQSVYEPSCGENVMDDYSKYC